MLTIRYLSEYVISKVPINSNSFVMIFLKSFDGTKGTGLDCLGPKILKIAPEILYPNISYLINKNLVSGVFPQPWKEAKVKLILYLRMVLKMIITITVQFQLYLHFQKLSKKYAKTFWYQSLLITTYYPQLPYSQPKTGIVFAINGVVRPFNSLCHTKLHHAKNVMRRAEVALD